MASKTALSKSKQGYGYMYVELSQIHEYLEEQGITYSQYVEVIDGNDYVMTVLKYPDGKTSEPLRGCRIMLQGLQDTKNPAQAYGAGITYARRYSLLMVLGLCTADDDAAACEKKSKKAVEIPEDVAGAIKELATGNKSKATLLNLVMAQLGLKGKKLDELSKEELVTIYTKLI